jgi:hypothetical protein
MTFWTAHIRPGDAPVLVREGFSWGAFLFGPLWLAGHRAWIPAALALAGSILIVILLPLAVAIITMFALAILLGLSGQDFRRWSMDHRGFTLTQVIAARSEPEALSVLLARRPDLVGRFLPLGATR